MNENNDGLNPKDAVISDLNCRIFMKTTQLTRSCPQERDSKTVGPKPSLPIHIDKLLSLARHSRDNGNPGIFRFWTPAPAGAAIASFYPKTNGFNPLRTGSLRSLAEIIGKSVLCVIGLIGLWAAAPTPRVVLFLGDSITAGYGLDSFEAYPEIIQKKIDTKGWNFKVVNAGQSGDTSAGGLSRLDWVLKNKVDVLVLELGGNDGLRGLPVAEMKKNLQAIIDRTKQRYPGVKIVVAGMKLPPNMGRDYGRQFEAVFPDLAKRNNAPLVPFVLEGVGGTRELNLADGIHPTAKGHEIVANNVWKVLEPVLRSLN
jgi:acyl-CoA thioesterase I